MAEQLEQTTLLLENVGVEPKQVIVDPSYRGSDKDNPDVEIIYRGKYRSPSRTQRRWLRRRQAVELVIGHLKAEHRMDKCWLQGQLGDALHAVLWAAGFNLCWLMRAVARMGLRVVFLCVLHVALAWATEGDRRTRDRKPTQGGRLCANE